MINGPPWAGQDALHLVLFHQERVKVRKEYRATETMFKSIMWGTRENKIGCAQLFDVPQTLKLPTESQLSIWRFEMGNLRVDELSEESVDFDYEEEWSGVINDQRVTADALIS